MADDKDIFQKELAEGGDVCIKALESNWDGILAAAILEII